MPAGRTGWEPVFRLARTELGQQLALGFEPIGLGVAGQTEPVAAFGDEVSARTNLVVRGMARRGSSRAGRSGRAGFRRGVTFSARWLFSCRSWTQSGLTDLRLGVGWCSFRSCRFSWHEVSWLRANRSRYGKRLASRFLMLLGARAGSA